MNELRILAYTKLRKILNGRNITLKLLTWDTEMNIKLVKKLSRRELG
jgi:hypothetical protein